ncbi:methyltransferase domain-containing protein [Kribbella sp. NPDC050470]|uniref:methyltransferase domain-containing protein n=1 Tax=unclassified Kribbella TaxID=2644121 RepID=UPI0037ABE2C7
MTETDESGIDLSSRGSFKIADAETQDAAKLAMVLDLMARRPAVQTLRAWALEQLAPVAGETAVDVGSGTGEDVVALAKLVGPQGHAIGIEPSPGLRAEAHHRATKATAKTAAANGKADGEAEAAAGAKVDGEAEAAAGAEVDGEAGAAARTGAAAGAGAEGEAGVAARVEAVAEPRADGVAGRVGVGDGGGVEFVDGDVGALPFAGESVDVVRCERVLQHVADAGGAVREMARVLRPGGRIVLIDTDWATAIVHPADPVVLQKMVDHFLADSANPYSGRRLRGQLAAAGLEITGETAATWIEAQEGARQGFASMMHLTALHAGVITEAEAEAFAKDLADAADRGAFHLSLTMYAVSARKPA